MPNITSIDMIALCVEGFLCGMPFYVCYTSLAKAVQYYTGSGIYSGIFVTYLQYQTSKEGTDKTNNILFYSHCALYVLSVAAFASDIAGTIMIPVSHYSVSNFQ
ncbi:hypothetical protein BYT27DRAFT_6789041 [Phlegmacium glaucopus]|nr:hypothetical protein BYT27DRAFT_6789041 [Phlegmacium glaucopus]